MNSNSYQSMAMRTKADPAKILERLNQLGPAYLQAWLGSNGLTDEGGEISAILKASIEYGKGPIDVVHLKEEIGDALWRLAQIADAFSLTFEECMRHNIEKLKKRYPDTFTDYLALNRNLSAERLSLEQPLYTFMFEEQNRRGEYVSVVAHSIDEARKKVLEDHPPGAGVLESEYVNYYKLVAHDFVDGTDQPKAAPLHITGIHAPEDPGKPLQVIFSPVSEPLSISDAGFAEPPERDESAFKDNEWVETSGYYPRIGIDQVKWETDKFYSDCLDEFSVRIGELSPVPGRGRLLGRCKRKHVPSTGIVGVTRLKPDPASPGMNFFIDMGVWSFGKPSKAGSYEWFYTPKGPDITVHLQPNWAGSDMNSWPVDVYYRKV